MTLFSSKEPESHEAFDCAGHGMRHPSIEHWAGCALNNEPNQILLSIREGFHDVDSALDLLQDDAREWWTPIVTDQMIDHAYRVLTRLTRLTEAATETDRHS